MEKDITTQTKQAPKILIVDDDPICCFLAENLLKEYALVETVTNGHDALEAIEKSNFDFILMDINLNNSEMDGIRTMRMIRYHRKHKNIKILAVTAKSGAREWFLNEGFDGHYMKPLVHTGIIEEIKATLSARLT
ncbi:MAG: putative sensor protein [Bacteroidetes bacterium]|jgi:CheY-like chemotaxis protein|nr:putative sensor protein [Bacteroidota bacterium]